MTTTPAAGPGAPARRPPPPRLSWLLKRPVTDRRGESLGRLADVIVRLRGTDYPLVTGLVASVGGRDVFVPVDQGSSFDSDPLRLSSARLSLGHRLTAVRSARLVRAAALELARITTLDPPHADPPEPPRAEWVLAGVDTRRRSRRPGRLGSGRSEASPGGSEERRGGKE